jgi:microcystin degradation protein MlrC
MARIALAGFLHETNTFAPLPTRLEDFTQGGGAYAGLLTGNEIFGYRGKKINRGAAGFINRAESLGHVIVPLVFAAAEPANQVARDAFETIMRMIIEGLKEKGPFDGLYLDLHGAMVVEDFVDGETEILQICRDIVGDIPITVSLDLHGNISRESFDLASVMIGYRTYPHTDVYQTGERCADAMQLLLDGKQVFKAFRQVPFLMPLTTQSTRTEPVRSLMELVEQTEQKSGVVSASFLPGFAPADLPHTGPTVFTYAYTQEDAETAAEEILQTILSREAEFDVLLLNPEQAVEKAIELAKKNSKPIVLADVQDNAGAGGTSDTTWILEALVKQNAPRTALGVVFDAQAAEIAHKAGEGAQITIGLGGKLTPGQNPFEGTFLVKKQFEGEFLATGPMFNGMPADLGKMANLQIGHVEVVVASSRTQANDQSYFKVLGIEPTEMQILVLKSSNHYRADFEPIAGEIIPVDAPGAFTEDARKTPYQNLREGVRLGGMGPANRKRK